MIKFLFWFSFNLVLFIYLGYPLILTVLGFIFKKPHNVDENFMPEVSLLIPAYNEEKIISEKIENSLSLDYPKDKFEIIVILDGCTDRSRNIADRYVNQGVKIIEQKPRKGKMMALNTSVSEAKGDILIFTDANAIYKKDAIKKLIRNFADEKIGCVCGELRYIGGSSTNEGESLYWKYERFLKISESQLQSLLVVNGPIYAIRKKLFEPVDESLADDFVIPMRIAKKGYGLIYESEAIAVEKIAERAKEEFNRKVRIISQGFKASFAICGIILSTGLLRILQFAFHKFIRWLTFLFLMSIFVSNLFLLDYWFYRVTFIVQVLFYSAALIGYFLEKKMIKIKIFDVPFYFCMVNIASFIGLLRFLTIGIKATWEKAESTR
ncbi:MAG: glycosyltransferase family 2 protein [Candidatus Omnitrophica bacterium]|nr:glycosyltransferase family 2 protein [Candidatus Omnitrophota bacterium]MBU4478280.1 glycosyltransferase family 2 protein [Candidatus Omnitrophota bacterium]MCG2703348.1 glycosyltransferase family 2 protein [Candidatus Omnitrophota bacterium]